MKNFEALKSVFTDIGLTWNEYHFSDYLDFFSPIFPVLDSDFDLNPYGYSNDVLRRARCVVTIGEYNETEFVFDAVGEFLALGERVK